MLILISFRCFHHFRCITCVWLPFTFNFSTKINNTTTTKLSKNSNLKTGLVDSVLLLHRRPSKVDSLRRLSVGWIKCSMCLVWFRNVLEKINLDSEQTNRTFFWNEVCFLIGDSKNFFRTILHNTVWGRLSSSSVDAVLCILHFFCYFVVVRLVSVRFEPTTILCVTLFYDSIYDWI